MISVSKGKEEITERRSEGTKGERKGRREEKKIFSTNDKPC